MKYSHVLNYVASTPWAILPSKMDEILAALAFKAAGGEFTPEEIQARIGGAQPGTSMPSGKGIALVSLRGTIAHRMGTMADSSGGMSAERFSCAIRQLAADETVGIILIDVDSPGGTVAGIPEAAQEVFNARATKRIVAIANSKMASAAYWICSQAHELVAIPSAFDGVIGSIGVFTAHRNMAAALEKEGVSITMISAGPHKLDGNPLGPLSDETRAELQAMVDSVYARFVKDVARGRGVKPSDVKAGFGQGRGLSAVDALAAGMIDRIATMEETIGRLSGGARSGSGRMSAEAPSGVTTPEASDSKPAKADMVEPEDGECPDGYEMGEDGMCHLMPMDEEAKKAAAQADAEQVQARADHDALAVMIAAGE